MIARSAPASTSSVPSTSAAKAIHNLRAGNVRACASNVVPTGDSPASPDVPLTARTNTFGAAARAITLRMPDHDAIRAAVSLLAMPPLPPPAPVAVGGDRQQRIVGRHPRTSRADGSRPGSAV